MPTKLPFDAGAAIALLALAVAGCGGSGGGGGGGSVPVIVDFTTTGLGGGIGVARETTPNAFTVTGSGFPVVGTPVAVRFTTSGASTGLLRFSGGTSSAVDVPAVVATDATVTGTTPLATGTTSLTTTVRVVVGISTSNAIGPVTFAPPPVVSGVASNLEVRENGPGSFLSACSTRMTISGSGFHPAATVLVHDAVAGAGTPIGTGALEGVSVVNPTTIRGLSPRAPSLAADTPAAVLVTNPDGQTGSFASAAFVVRTKGHLQNTDVSLEAGTNAEMEAAVDPTDPKNLATLSHGAGAAMRFAHSADAGTTWAQSNLGTSVDGMSGGFRSDPRVAYDRFGNLYAAYMHIPGANAGKTMIVLQSYDKGATWSTVKKVTDAAEGMDKPFLVIGPDGSDLSRDAIYVGWDDTASTFTPGTGVGIVVAMATCTGAGVAMSAIGTPVDFVDAPTGAGALANACVGSNGDLYVVWNDSSLDATGHGPTLIMMDRDPLGMAAGAGFGTDVTVASSNVGGLDAIPAQPTRTIYALAEVAVIRSGPHTGRAVVTWTRESPDESSDTDVVSSYTDTAGAAWSAVVRVNDDATTRSQFLPSVRLDPISGTLVAAWYDCRNDAATNRKVRVYAAASFDDGATWSANVQVSDGTSDVATRSDGNEYLDYLGLAMVDGEGFVSFTDSSGSAGGPDGTADAEMLVTRFQLR